MLIKVLVPINLKTNHFHLQEAAVAVATKASGKKVPNGVPKPAEAEEDSSDEDNDSSGKCRKY